MNKRIGTTPGEDFSPEAMEAPVDTGLELFRNAVETVVPYKIGRPVSPEIVDDVAISAHCVMKRFNSILGDMERRDQLVSALAGAGASNDAWAMADGFIPAGPVGMDGAQSVDPGNMQMPAYSAAMAADIWMDGLKATTRLPEAIPGAVVAKDGGRPVVLVSADLGFRESQVTVSQGLAAAIALQASAAGITVSDRAHFEEIANVLIDDQPAQGQSRGDAPWPVQEEVLLQGVIEVAIVLGGLGPPDKAGLQ